MMSVDPQSTDPIPVMARVIEFYRQHPAAVDDAPNVLPAELIAKEIIDALVANGILLTCEGWTDAN